MQTVELQWSVKIIRPEFEFGNLQGLSSSSFFLSHWQDLIVNYLTQKQLLNLTGECGKVFMGTS